MNTQKALVGGLVALLVFGGGWYWYSRQSATHAPIQAAQLNADLTPLYAGTTWTAPVATTSPDFGTVVMSHSAVFSDTTNIAGVSTPFTQYYHDKLAAAGWTQDMSREAGGPGSEMSVYTKGDQFVVVYFHSDFLVRHTDAPSECPCDVTLVLMSGTTSANPVP